MTQHLFNAVERRRIDRLERRADYLAQRIERRGAIQHDGDHDIAELSALRWIIDAVEALKSGSYLAPVETKPSMLRRSERSESEAR